MNKNLSYLIQYLLRAIKLTLTGVVLQCILSHVQVQANTTPDIHDVKVNLDINGKSLREIFSLIEQETDFTFTYSSRKIDLSQRFFLSYPSENLGALLDAVAIKANIVIKQADNILMVQAREIRDIRRAPAQGSIRGRILDEQLNDVLPGASILQKGTNIGTTSDVNGEFLLRVQSGMVDIVITYIGYKKFETSLNVPENGTADVEYKLTSDVTS